MYFAKELSKLCVQKDQTIRQAIEAIDAGGLGIALVVDADRKLEGILTDGDVRRAILKGASLATPLLPYVNRNFLSVSPAVGRAEVLDQMQARTFRQIPIVDQENRLLGLHDLHGILGYTPRENIAVIMAGGRGLRLRPMTETIPKPMLKVAGRPILERLVLHLVGFGFQKIYLAINYLSDAIEKHFEDGRRFGCRIEYLREKEELGTGGALSLLPASPQLPLVVMNGDLVTQVNISDMLDFHVENQNVATIGVSQYVWEVPFGCVSTNDDLVERIDEKPVYYHKINAGVYVFSPHVLERVPRKFFPITALFNDCLDRGERVGAYEIVDDWIDVGHHDQLNQARGGDRP